MRFENINSVLVIGMGSSGVSSAELLIKLNKSVYVYDSRSADEVTTISDKMHLKFKGAFFGVEPTGLIESNILDMAVISPGVALDIPIVEKLKKAKVKIIGELELGYLYAKGRFLAITGTNGKTTTTSLVGKICECENILYDVVGNIGKPVTQGVLDNELEKTWVTEVSSFQLETIDRFKPAVCAILNITPDHLNRHKTMENYINAKKRVYENQDSKDTLVLNANDLTLMDVKNEFDNSHLENLPNIFYFGKERIGERCVYLKDDIIMICDKFNKDFNNDEVFGISIINVNELQILGQHNVENAMAATALCYCAGISINAIKQGLREFEAVEHRLQKIAEFDEIEFYNDSKATNPDAAIKALQAIKKPIILIAGGMDKKNDFAEFLYWVNKKVKNMIVFGETSHILKQTSDKCGYKDVVVVDNMKSAVKKAVECAKSGDVVLLSPACASWDMYKNYQVRGVDFKNCVLEMRGTR